MGPSLVRHRFRIADDSAYTLGGNCNRPDVQMTKQQLLEVLNADALALRIDPFTIRQLSDWIDEKVIDGAKAKGLKRGTHPDWQFSEEAVACARFVVKSISCGSTRKAQHRVFVWVHGHEYSFDRIRHAVISEFGRFLKRQRRQHEWQYDHRNRADPKRKAAHLKQIPKLDDDLKNAGLEQPPEAILQIISEAHWGTDETGSSLKSLLEQMAPQFGVPGEHLVESIPKMSISGLLGNPDEMDSSALAILKVATKDDFDKGCETIQFYLGQINQLNSLEGFPENEILGRMADAFQKAANSILRPDWLISTTASAIVAAYKHRKGIRG
jgi:hypothetical protein